MTTLKQLSPLLKRHVSVTLASISLAIGTGACFAQSDAPVTLKIVVAVTPEVQSRPFANAGARIGSIVSVNGRKAGGTWMSSSHFSVDRPVTTLVETVIWDNAWTFDITDAVGIPAGVITAGYRRTGVETTYTVVSGTRAYLGVSGTVSVPGLATAPEDWNNGPAEFLLFTAELHDVTIPLVASYLGQPAILHASDLSPVSAAQPAKPGEVLTLYAQGLLPPHIHRPQRNPTPLAVQVMVEGVLAEILYAAPCPGAGDSYQVNVRMPSAGFSNGQTQLIISSGFIESAPVMLASTVTL